MPQAPPPPCTPPSPGSPTPTPSSSTLPASRYRFVVAFSIPALLRSAPRSAREDRATHIVGLRRGQERDHPRDPGRVAEHPHRLRRCVLGVARRARRLLADHIQLQLGGDIAG